MYVWVFILNDPVYGLYSNKSKKNDHRCDSVMLFILVEMMHRIISIIMLFFLKYAILIPYSKTEYSLYGKYFMCACCSSSFSTKVFSNSLLNSTAPYELLSGWAEGNLTPQAGTPFGSPECPVSVSCQSFINRSTKM